MLVVMVIIDERRQQFFWRTRQVPLVNHQHRILSLGEGRFVLAMLTVL
jgi:hypothetical protein